MQVRLGWTGETEPNRWSKVDVTVDEGDLTRMLLDAQIGSAVQDKLPIRVVFQLMQNEAENLLLSKLTGEGYPAERAQQRRTVLDKQNTALLTAIKDKQA